MLTDIFADRYSGLKIWDVFAEPQRRLVVQTFKLLAEDICPYWRAGKEDDAAKAFWSDIHSQLSRELGLSCLSPMAYSYEKMSNGQTTTVSGLWTIDKVCENWALKPFDGSTIADRFIKERLSLVELGFRRRGEEIAAANLKLPKTIREAEETKLLEIHRALRLPDYIEGLKASNDRINAHFQVATEELNARLRQAGCNLHYHNGYIQGATDELVEDEIETPFWKLVRSPLWKNVDLDMKEALDRRDSQGRDPAFYAARALESTLKVISSEKAWTNGKEKGAHNYIDNLASKAAAFISPWEADVLKALFTKIRNPLGHGPGKEEMPNLSVTQTDWVIESCMVWIKSLIRRM